MVGLLCGTFFFASCLVAVRHRHVGSHDHTHSGHSHPHPHSGPNHTHSHGEHQGHSHRHGPSQHHNHSHPHGHSHSHGHSHGHGHGSGHSHSHAQVETSAHAGWHLHLSLFGWEVTVWEGGVEWISLPADAAAMTTAQPAGSAGAAQTTVTFGTELSLTQASATGDVHLLFPLLLLPLSRPHADCGTLTFRLPGPDDCHSRDRDAPALPPPEPSLHGYV